MHTKCTRNSHEMNVDGGGLRLCNAIINQLLYIQLLAPRSSLYVFVQTFDNGPILLLPHINITIHTFFKKLRLPGTVVVMIHGQRS